MAFQDNYGGALTYYALYKTIEKFGYNPILIYNNKLWYVGNNNSIYDDANGHRFALSYANIYNEYFEENQLDVINKLCDTFIVGSDEVWKYKTHRDNIYYFLLNFATNDKKKIAFSSAFNLRKYDGDHYSHLLFNHYLHQLDHISVRDYGSLNICKNEFLIDDVELIMDPVFMFDDYDYLVNKSKLKLDNKYMFVYIRKGCKEQDEYINYLSDKLKLDVYKTGKICFDDNKNLYDKNLSVEDWLSLIKNSEFVFTDSFHGACFAIIFNKPFITIRDVSLRKSSMVQTLGLENRMLNKFEDLIDNDIIYSNIDYDLVNIRLSKEKEKAINWLKNALKSEKKVTNENYKNELINILINTNKDLNAKLDKINSNFNTKLDEINRLINMQRIYLSKEITYSRNWLRLFGIYNTENYIFIYLFGIKLTFKVNEKSINRMAWWIPIRKWRDNFRDKFKL